MQGLLTDQHRQLADDLRVVLLARWTKGVKFLGRLLDERPVKVLKLPLWVDLAPDEEHFRQQLDYCCILEERQLLVSATHILLDLLIEKDVAFLSYLVLTAYFLSGLTGAFIRGFLGSDRGPYFVFDFGPPLASFFNVDHLFLVASRLANFCYQF